MTKLKYPLEQCIVTASVCPIANDKGFFEILTAYADGREVETFSDKRTLIRLRDNIDACMEYAK